MKFYILFIAVILAVGQVKSDMEEQMHNIEMACREETHVTEDELKNFFENKMKEEPKENLKCHLKCFLEKQGIWKNGAVDENAVKQFLQSIPALKDKQDEINKALDDCKTKKGSFDCDTVYLIMKCMGEHKAVLI